MWMHGEGGDVIGLPTVPCAEDEWRSVSEGDWRELHQWIGAQTHCHSDQVVWFITAAAREKAIKQHSCRQLNAKSRFPCLPLPLLSLSLPLTLSYFSFSPFFLFHPPCLISSFFLFHPRSMSLTPSPTFILLPLTFSHFLLPCLSSTLPLSIRPPRFFHLLCFCHYL